MNNPFNKFFEKSLENSDTIAKVTKTSELMELQISTLEKLIKTNCDADDAFMQEMTDTLKNLSQTVMIHNKSIARLAELVSVNQKAIIELNAVQVEIAKALRGNSIDTKLPPTNTNKTSKPN